LWPTDGLYILWNVHDLKNLFVNWAKMLVPHLLLSKQAHSTKLIASSLIYNY